MVLLSLFLLLVIVILILILLFLAFAICDLSLPSFSPALLPAPTTASASSFCNFPNPISPARLILSVQPKPKASSFEPAHFISRELSWLEFNQRVLEEALDPQNPLLERLKFFCIVSSNLDEFFEVRVAGIKQQIESDFVERSMDGLTATETFKAVTHRIRRMVDDQYACWRQSLLPALAQNGIRILDMSELDLHDLGWLLQYYRAQVRPVLTPLAIDPAHPFPQLLNKSLNLIVRLEMAKGGGEPLKHMAVVQMPRILPRMVKLPRSDARQDYVYLSRLIGHHLARRGKREPPQSRGERIAQPPQRRRRPLGDR